MGRLSKEHWLLVAGFLGAMAITMTSLDTWADLNRPAVLGGFVAQLALMIRALFTERVAPKDDPGTVTPPAARGLNP